MFLLSLAFAAPTQLTGHYSISSSTTQLEATQQAELAASLASLPSVLRPLGEHFLKPTLFYCKVYEMVVTNDSFSNRCDDKPPLLRPFNAESLPMTVGDIKFISRVSMEGDTVLLILEGKYGTRATRYTLTPSGLHVKVTVSSEKLERPMNWEIDYRRD